MSREGFVYVVDLGINGLYKIGRTKDFERRLKSLRSGNTLLKKVLCVWVHDALAVEYYLHQRFKSKNIEREVFKLKRKDIVFIGGYLNSRTPSKVAEHRYKKAVEGHYIKQFGIHKGRKKYQELVDAGKAPQLPCVSVFDNQEESV